MSIPLWLGLLMMFGGAAVGFTAAALTAARARADAQARAHHDERG